MGPAVPPSRSPAACRLLCLSRSWSAIGSGESRSSSATGNGKSRSSIGAALSACGRPASARRPSRGLAGNRAFLAPGALAEHSGTTSPTALLAITTIHFDAVRLAYIRRNQRTGELALCRWWMPRPVPLAVLVRVARTRWIVEERFQTSRGRCLQAVIATTALNGGTADTGLTGTAGRIADLQSSHPWRPAAKTATPRRLDTGLVHRTGRPRGPGRSGAPGRRSGPPGAPRQCHPRPPQPRYPWRRLPRVLRVPPPTWRRWQADPGRAPQRGRSGRSPRVRTARRAPRCPAFAKLARTAQPTPAPQHGPSCDPITGPVASTWQRF